MGDLEVFALQQALGTQAGSFSVLERIAVGRDRSYFEADMAARVPDIARRLDGARVLVIGGAGSIGAATIALLGRHRLKALHVVDLNENGLVELIRDLRSRTDHLKVEEFRTLPIDYGSPIMARFLAEARPYDLVLNFAALKHVRSEKDVYSMLQMVDTNLVKHRRFKHWLGEHDHHGRYFAVSTDKAANPLSVMGATKRLGEEIIFENGPLAETSSARFANVAFSNGSLLQSFLIRFSKRQPLAVPRDTRRFFVTLAEAGEICLLAGCWTPSGTIAFPTLDPAKHLCRLDEIAAALLHSLGYTPAFYTDEEAARREADQQIARKQYPLLLTPLDTAGEKPYEEFVGEGERVAEIGLSSLSVIQHRPMGVAFEGLFSTLESATLHASSTLDKASIVELISATLPQFKHRASAKNLDDRM